MSSSLANHLEGLLWSGAKSSGREGAGTEPGSRGHLPSEGRSLRPVWEIPSSPERRLRLDKGLSFPRSVGTPGAGLPQALQHCPGVPLEPLLGSSSHPDRRCPQGCCPHTSQGQRKRSCWAVGPVHPRLAGGPWHVPVLQDTETGGPCLGAVSDPDLGWGRKIRPLASACACSAFRGGGWRSELREGLGEAEGVGLRGHGLTPKRSPLCWLMFPDYGPGTGEFGGAKALPRPGARPAGFIFASSKRKNCTAAKQGWGLAVGEGVACWHCPR